MSKRVKSLEYVGGHRLRLAFTDGIVAEVDFAKFLRFTRVFAPHRDPAFFARAYCDGFTVCWPNDTDVCPDVLYGWATGRDPLEVMLDGAPEKVKRAWRRSAREYERRKASKSPVTASRRAPADRPATRRSPSGRSSGRRRSAPR